MIKPIDEFAQSEYELALHAYYDASSELYTAIDPIIQKGPKTSDNETVAKCHAFVHVTGLLQEYQNYAGDLTEPKQVALEILQHSNPPYCETVNSTLPEDMAFTEAFSNFCIAGNKIVRFPQRNAPQPGCA